MSGLLSEQAERELLRLIEAGIVRYNVREDEKYVVAIPQKKLREQWGITANTLKEFEKNGLKRTQPTGKKGVVFYRIEELDRFFKEMELK